MTRAEKAAERRDRADELAALEDAGEGCERAGLKPADTNSPTLARAAAWMREQQRWAEDEGLHSRAAYCRVAADAMEANARLLAEREELVGALRELTRIVTDARADEECDASTQAGGYLFCDEMSDAVEHSDALLSRLLGGGNAPGCDGGPRP